jgi:hypothetical protein
MRYQRDKKKTMNHTPGEEELEYVIRLKKKMT